jgi:transitional endoplasmic reticulum ATPase
MTVSNDDSKDLSKSATLKVAEAEQRDVGSKIARVDPVVADALKFICGVAL